MSEHKSHHSGLSPYLSPVAVWALAVGTSVGWGSMVVTCNTYLAQAGPLGSVLGILIGAAVMLVVTRNLGYLINHHPGAGGIYTITRDIFGYDRAFLIAWFTGLTYMAMFWANATSLPLFARFFFGESDPFRFGYLYTVFGYEVYLGEALLTIGAIVLVALLCVRSRHATAHVMTALVLLFTVGIAVCFFVAIFGMGGSDNAIFEPAFIPDESAVSQIFLIVFISPWAFVGFENVTHSSEEFKFSRKKTFRILVIAILTTTLLYVFVTLLSVTAYPPEYASWLDYISHLSEETGIRALPPFYAAHHYLGNAGLGILYASLFALIITSLIGNIRALSRLFYALAKDEILPRKLAHINRRQIPSRAILLLAGLSCVVPFLGRTAIGWIVDVTTLGATLLYGFISAAAYKSARRNHRNTVKVTGLAGLILMIMFGVYLLFPDLFQNEALATETYFLFVVWSVVGMVYFSFIIRKDHARRFGKAIIVWVALIALVVFMAMVWTARTEGVVAKNTVEKIQEFYDNATPEMLAGEDAFLHEMLQDVHDTNSLTTAVVLGLFALAVGVMLGNHFSAKKWENKAVRERDSAREAAYRDPLTGVKSKTAYAETEAKIDRELQGGISAPFAVVVCDVNGLKYVNDTRGHQAGDQLIREASSLICEHFKHSPVFRIGGDEFVVLPEGPDLEQREEILRELDALMEKNIESGNAVVSTGAAAYIPGEDEHFHDVFSRADKAMYRRKLELKEKGAVTRT